MKKKFRVIICIFLCIFLLSGCSFAEAENKSLISAPNNIDLKIKGAWEAEPYKVLEENVLSSEEIENIISNTIEIRDNSIKLGEENLGKIRYKVKIVKPNYTISYENKYKVSNLLGNDSGSINVYSFIYQNKILAEFFYKDIEESFLYYQGIIFKLRFNSNVKVDEDELYEYRGDSISKDESMASEGVYIALKQSTNSDEVAETYRTLWINTKDGVLQDVKERENIIFPRLKGIWYLEPKFYVNKEKNIKYQYFSSNPIEGTLVEPIDDKSKPLNSVEDDTTLLRSINFIGNDYIATEVSSNNNKYKSNYYEVLPIDNMNISTGVSIGDLYAEKESYSDFTEGYKEVYKRLSDEQKNSLTQYIDYSNFTLERDSGKWVVSGRISSLKSKDYIDFATKLKPTKRLLNYDTLLISWKLLKGTIPYMVDAYTSPYKSLAIIILKDELLIYRIIDGTLSDEPLKSIHLKDNEEVIMAEWCSSNYIERWDSAFKENSRIIN